MPASKHAGDLPDTYEDGTDGDEELENTDEQPIVATLPPLNQSGVVPQSPYSESIGRHSLSSMPPAEKYIKKEEVSTLIHDANQFLTAIISGADLALIKTDNREIIKMIADSGAKLRALFEQFRRESLQIRPVAQPAAKENINRPPVNINDVLQTQIAPRKNLYGDRMAFLIHLPESIIVCGDIDDIHRILENMFVNARRSIEEHEGPGILNIRLIVNEKSAHIVMTDNGSGIAAENRRRIFKKGFSTKQEGGGVGLYYSRKRARKIGGNLELFDNSEIPENYGGPAGHTGATAVFTLPLYDDNNESLNKSEK